MQMACNETSKNESKNETTKVEETSINENKEAVDSSKNEISEESPNIDKTELINNFSKYLFNNDSIENYKIIQYEIIITNREGVIVAQKVKGDKLPDSVIDKINEDYEGEIVIISGVKAEVNGETIRVKGSTYRLQ